MLVLKHVRPPAAGSSVCTSSETGDKARREPSTTHVETTEVATALQIGHEGAVFVLLGKKSRDDSQALPRYA